MSGRRPGRGLLFARRLAAAAVLAALLLAAYLLWLRDSSLVAVEKVEVSGVTVNRGEVTAALEAAAREMTTLHVDTERLREAVAPYPTVAGLSADPSFPDSLEIAVVERLPVAVAEIGGNLVPVAADGWVLTGLKPDRQLPSLEAARAPHGRLDRDGAAQAQILGAAPAALAAEIEGSSWEEEVSGVVVVLDGAPELRFGDGDQAEAKWAAAAAVLADPELGAPAYVDVSVPGRPVAG